MTLAQKIELIFFDICSEYKRLTLDETYNDLSSLKRLCKEWESLVTKEYFPILVGFRQTYYDELVSFIHFLRQSRDDELRGFHDRVFLNIFEFKKKVPRGITKKFADFIGGITYFKDEAESDVSPVYHRLSSCGDGSDAFRNLYQRCTPDLPLKQRKEIMRRIMTCYIERLIYDNMYSHYSPDGSQNEGHAHRLRITQEDFHSCFPHTDVKIAIEYEQHLPYQIQIEIRKQDELVSTEKYVKSIVFKELITSREGASDEDVSFLYEKVYSPMVVCFRWTKKHAYTKTQSFNVRNDWRRVDQDT